MTATKKFSFVEVVFMTLITLFADGFEALVGFLGFVPILTPIALGLNWLINILTLAIIGLWFIIKKERATWILAGSLIKLLPYLQVLPIRTITCLIGVYLANHPKAVPLAKAKLTKLKTKPSKSPPQSSPNPIEQTT